ncbi:uncharacterized protein LOC131944145 [Physella acuta]|uniref:uncharacterized protein LOC131944145 n=1 Tax=Physella acuta TaxID=109671 RepID=UPI0027DB9E90|nr:uncharacterized protein LOC131944145 [Physella acuta]
MSGYLIVLLLGAFVGQVMSQVICGNKACIKEAFCAPNNTCTCKNPPFVRGDGYFGCYRQNTVDAEVRNDPTLTTFNEETVNFPYPCRYMITHVKQELKSGGSVIGNCELKVYGFNARAKGKLYSRGYQLAVKLTYNSNTPSPISLSTTTYGEAGSTTTERNNFYNCDGPFTPVVPVATTPTIVLTAPPSVKVLQYFEPTTQQNIFQIDSCGLRVTFVPYNLTSTINSPFLPGISVGINCAHHPIWLSNNTVMGLAPVSQGGKLIAAIQAEYPGLSPADAMLQRAFTRNVIQNQPGASSQCSNVGSLLGACNATELDALYANVDWIFDKYPPFVRCLSGTTTDANNLLDLFIAFINLFCNQACVYTPVHNILGTCVPSNTTELTPLLAKVNATCGF